MSKQIELDEGQIMVKGVKGGKKDKESSSIGMKRVHYVMKGQVCDEAYNHGLNTMN